MSRDASFFGFATIGVVFNWNNRHTAHYGYCYESGTVYDTFYLKGYMERTTTVEKVYHNVRHTFCF